MIRVALAIQRTSLFLYAYLDKLHDQLADVGIQIVPDDQPHDLLLIDDRTILDRYAKPDDIDQPMIVFERKDAATVQSKFRKWFWQPHIKLWIKSTVFRDLADTNLDTSSGHLHVDRIREAAGEVLPPPRYAIRKLTDDELGKIRPFTPVYMFSNFDYIRELSQQKEATKPLADRGIDLISAGEADHGWPAIQHHRRIANVAAVGLVGRIAMVGRGRVFSRKRYYQYLEESKISLSPFGYGEMNWKDWEAVMTGTIIIKPPIHYVTTAWYDIYRKGGATIDCALDFSDLPEVVDQVLSDLDKHQERMESERKALLSCAEPTLLASQFADLVKEALARP